ncbi:hypothetical protein C823_004285 [Eubacterium plexicaudatum ASF492]|nr:hypothetical protein C823_004285 [Eubacterium plexicaudatum ASF492]
MVFILGFAAVLMVPLGIYLYILIRRFLGLFFRNNTRLRMQKSYR